MARPHIRSIQAQHLPAGYRRGILRFAREPAPFCYAPPYRPRLPEALKPYAQPYEPPARW